MIGKTTGNENKDLHEFTRMIGARNEPKTSEMMQQKQ